MKQKLNSSYRLKTNNLAKSNSFGFRNDKRKENETKSLTKIPSDFKHLLIKKCINHKPSLPKNWKHNKTKAKLFSKNKTSTKPKSYSLWNHNSKENDTTTFFLNETKCLKKQQQTTVIKRKLTLFEIKKWNNE